MTRPHFFLSLYLLVLFSLFSLAACSARVAPTARAGISLPTSFPITTSPVNPSPSSPSTSQQADVSATSPAISSPLVTQSQPIVVAQTTSITTGTSSTLPGDEWESLPIIPTVSDTARQIYQHGLELGNDPHAFSKVGDCQSISTYFLSYFDRPVFYNLGSYSDLQATIDWYSGSFLRESLSVKGGFNAAAILSPLRADPKQCTSAENPVACEFRLHHPSVAIISLEEWWAGHPENYEAYLRQIIEYAIEQGVVPVLATKADNLEGNNLINQTIARLSKEYDIPLWNFWLAVQSLPNHGLIAINSSGAVDMFHLTHSEGYYFYNDPAAVQSGWSVRNLTALQALDAVRRGLNHLP